MRRIREVTAEEENFRVEELAPNIGVVKRDPVEPEPVGTIVLLPFRIAGYARDCDGSLMALLDAIDGDLDETGWSQRNIGLYDDSGFVVTEDELKQLFNREGALSANG